METDFKKILTRFTASLAFFLLLISTLVTSSSVLQAAPSIYDITTKGDRNLKIISFIYDKYQFMPAKKEYLKNLQDEWIKGKSLYSTAQHGEKKERYDKLLQAYNLTNDVLKDICIDMANLSEAVVDDFTQKLIESENPKANHRNKNYHRFVVSRNEFTRAEYGFKKGMYYYSASLYDHGIEIMKHVYSEQKWNFPKGKSAIKENKDVSLIKIIAEFILT
ncbi:MAG: hypothetical protein OEV78_01430 [Spirochaetia bacterium]|nr:hypothetical protein [Spirochaetia bacterium]